MSHQATTWAIAQKTGGPSAKTVLWSIANYANQHWCAWISQRLMVEESEQSIDSVARRVKDLEVLGLLRRIPLHFSGRKTVDFIILAPSPLFHASIEEIEPYLPAGCTIEPKWASLHAPANCGNVESGTSGATLPQTLPQIAPDAPALVRGQEPLREPEGESLSQTSSPEPRARREREISPPAPQGQTTPRDPRFDEIATAWPVKDNLAEARDVWERMAEPERAGAYGYFATFLAETGAKRKYIEQLVKWFRGQSWSYRKPAPATAKTVLEPFGKPWWWEWWRKLGAGEKVAFMGAEAMRGNAWTATAPDDAVMVAIKHEGDDFAAWQKAAEQRGARIPIPDAVPVIWVPCQHPADWHPDTKGQAA